MEVKGTEGRELVDSFLFSCKIRRCFPFSDLFEKYK